MSRATAGVNRADDLLCAARAIAYGNRTTPFLASIFLSSLSVVRRGRKAQPRDA
jgi:hypothetical protein